VDRKARAQLLLLLLFIVCAGSVAGVVWYRSRPIPLDSQLLRLPVKDALLLYVDFAELRGMGLLDMLAGSKTAQDADYQKFIQDTGFDYQQDLNTALVAFTPRGNYMLVGGKFDWTRLRSYAQAQGGQCYAAICRMVGSTPERRISFLPLQSSLMALAVSTNPNAVTALEGSSSGTPPEHPKAPVWLSVAGATLRSGQEMPAGTRMFARAVEQAERVSLALTPETNRLAARLSVRCQSAGEASSMAAELSRITGLLRDLIEREHQKPNSADFSGVLTSGTFRAEGTEVLGYWPIERAFLEGLLN
jgi:hypothetical protein